MAIFNDVDVVGVVVVVDLGLGPTGSRGEDRLMTKAHTQVLLFHPEDDRSTTSSVTTTVTVDFIVS